MTKKLKWLCILVLTSAMLSACTSMYNDAVLGNREHGLACAQLPTATSVERTIAEHKEVVDRILAVHNGFVFFDVDQETCPGKADIVISFATQDDRKQIEAILGSDTFFGVPLRLMNR